ncbi:uncharacterized protein PHALS_11358 [Plasmopara halstedii]|uniref:Uncharacterized protein n=1 Tax=Plasmopara halstedii TaxID=4781 RepID=A0A0P1A5T8_PLAHL|nr:uncharacterized protein PHALS_11358 [Plasmopara halstedii]CEG35478.1 hypothetical protein PHALS_11358 [Plasmopara halstedii]|eukprot:XP_024571847.1 hypothetical protein PHALS_11358 [Plasmopara halstedii]
MIEGSHALLSKNLETKADADDFTEQIEARDMLGAWVKADKRIYKEKLYSLNANRER